MDNDAVTKAEFYKEIGKLVTREEFQNELKKLATKEDLKNFATKEDLKNFATKEDLKNFATKEDLERFATKEDLERFATKEDLEKVDKKLTKEIKDLNSKYDWLAKKVMLNTQSIEALKKEVREGFRLLTDQMISRFDDLAGKFDDLRTEKIALDYGLRQVEKNLDQEKDRNDTQDENLTDHEERISKL